MMSGREVVMLSLLGGWFLCSVAAQIPGRLSERLRYWDVIYVLPFWSFFAPVPGRSDFFLLCRDTLEDGAVTDWLDVTPWEPRRFYDFLWNPGRRDRKRFLDLISLLLLLAADRPPESALQMSLPYLALLNYVASLRHPSNAVATQFLVMQRDHPGTHPAEPSANFVSASHSLASGSP